MILTDEKLDVGVEYEFLVLSESRTPAPTMGIRNRKEKGKWDLYWVMLIKWTDGIAERKGIGQMYHSSLDRAFPPGPIWKQIVLG